MVKRYSVVGSQMKSKTMKKASSGMNCFNNYLCVFVEENDTHIAFKIKWYHKKTIFNIVFFLRFVCPNKTLLLVNAIMLFYIQTE